MLVAPQARTPAPPVSRDQPRVAHYALAVTIAPTAKRLSGTATILVVNTTSRTVRSLPFLLYRLLSVDAAASGQGAPLAYQQRIVPMTGEPNWQVNRAVITLARPLAPGDTSSIRLTYAGAVFGYPEVMAYTHDQVSDEYTLLRPDVLAYPMLADADPSAFLGYDRRFGYELQVTVPRGVTVASGGAVGARTSSDSTETFRFASRAPTWRIDVAAARFTVLAGPGGDPIVYALKADSARAATVLQEIERVRAFYANRFGVSPKARAFTVIEIPEGWGSQASDFYILLAAAAFEDTGSVGQIYHEVGHAWNAEANPDVQRTRWFDEAFASYLEALALRQFEGAPAFENRMTAYRERFRRAVQGDARNGDTPIADYGREELGENSYTKGAWSLYILNELIGDQAFDRLMREFLQEFAARPAGFKDFETVAARISGRDLTPFFREWIYGTESSALLVSAATPSQIVQRYH
jgi:hypothetical protein